MGLVGNRHSIANIPEMKCAVDVAVIHEIHGAFPVQQRSVCTVEYPLVRLFFFIFMKIRHIPFKEFQKGAMYGYHSSCNIEFSRRIWHN